jgi:hypothetical protein
MVLGGRAVEEACRTEMRRTMAVLEMDCGELREVVWVDEGRRIERSSRRDIARVCYAVKVMSNGTEALVDFLELDGELASGLGTVCFIDQTRALARDL